MHIGVLEPYQDRVVSASTVCLDVGRSLCGTRTAEAYERFDYTRLNILR
jgi:hypothetical protein